MRGRLLQSERINEGRSYGVGNGRMGSAVSRSKQMNKRMVGPGRRLSNFPGLPEFRSALLACDRLQAKPRDIDKSGSESSGHLVGQRLHQGATLRIGYRSCRNDLRM
jgi:hypothetical protein